MIEFDSMMKNSRSTITNHRRLVHVNSRTEYARDLIKINITTLQKSGN